MSTYVDFRATHVDETYLPLVRNYYSRTSAGIPLLLPVFLSKRCEAYSPFTARRTKGQQRTMMPTQDEGNEAEEQISIFVTRSARRSPLMVRPRLPP